MVFFQVSEIPVNYRAGSAKMYGPQCHQTAKKSDWVRNWLWDNNNGVLWDSVHLGSVRQPRAAT